MYIYNTTYFVSKDIFSVWIEWVKSIHIGDMTRMGFSSPQIFKVLTTDSEQKELSISVQFTIESLEKLNEWKERYLVILKRDIYHRFGEKVLPFDTVLEIITKE
ncbi:MAG: hypothetical protein CR965_01515 [Paludibacter sp.]|nr:MAG: hypothetical protein CR965_01515 [Paludibacter sp.]